jgi:predicted alpha/beta superfamily hydrolase
MKKILLFISVCFLTEMTTAQEVKIPGTQTRKITSSIVAGQEYELQIMLPGNYSNTNRLYPVVYLMDSQWDFPLATAIYGEQYYDGFIPPMIIVGVTWGGTNPKPDSLRARDYTPSALIKELPQSGGAEKFLSFMKEELFPFVERNYRADKNDRTLMGCSFGGLFTIRFVFTTGNVSALCSCQSGLYVGQQCALSV